MLSTYMTHFFSSLILKSLFFTSQGKAKRFLSGERTWLRSLCPFLTRTRGHECPRPFEAVVNRMKGNTIICRATQALQSLEEPPGMLGQEIRVLLAEVKDDPSAAQAYPFCVVVLFPSL